MRRLRFIFALSVLLMPFSAWGAFNQGTGAGGSVDISDVTGLGSGVLSPLQTQAGIVGGLPTIGSTANGDCVEWGASGTLLSTGAACGGGGGSGTVSNGTIGQLAQYAATGTTVSGLTPGSGVLAALQAPVGGVGSFPTNGPGWVSPIHDFNASGLNSTGIGAMTSGSPTLTLAFALNGLANGDPYQAAGAGAAGAALNTTIVSGAGTLSLTLAANASTTVTAARVGLIGSMTAGSPTLTMTSTAGWKAGYGIDVAGVGASGAELIATVSAVAAGSLTLSASASTSATNALVNFDDTAAMVAALASKKNVHIDAGQYNFTSANALAFPQWVQGDGAVLVNMVSSPIVTIPTGAGTEIWNRGKTNDVFDITSGGSALRGIGIEQAFDITPTAGCAIKIGSGSSSLLVGMAVEQDEVYNTFCLMDANEGLQASSVSFDKMYGGADTSSMVTWNVLSPAGNTSIVSLDIENQANANLTCLIITGADTTIWTSLKLDECSVGASLAATAVNNQIFNGISAEDIAGDAIDILGGNSFVITAAEFGNVGGNALNVSGTANHVSMAGCIASNNLTGSVLNNTGSGTDISAIGCTSTSSFPSIIANGIAVVGQAIVNANIISGTVPIGTTGACVASAFAGGSAAGTFKTTSACAGTNVILTGFGAGGSFSGWSCSATDQTTPADIVTQIASTSVSVTFKATTAANDVVQYSCQGW